MTEEQIDLFHKLDVKFNKLSLREHLIIEEATKELKDELKKWKDEWQEQVQKATDEGYARTLQTIQLTKAKDILQRLMENQPTPSSMYEEIDLVGWREVNKEAKQFLKEIK